MRADEKLTAFLELESAIRDMQHRFQNFPCNAAQNFGKEWETVCVSGLPGTTAANPKQQKEIKL
jgi:hypothetical protein